MPADTLKATIDTWNQDVNAKDDKQFGRTTGMEADKQRLTTQLKLHQGFTTQWVA